LQGELLEKQQEILKLTKSGIDSLCFPVQNTGNELGIKKIRLYYQSV